MVKDKFQISLRENGEHSFKKSIESYEEYGKTKDQMLLKDTIMFLHHSIELLMKEMLVRHSQYLIFEDLKDVPRKQKDANEKGIGIFFINNPPKSVTYDIAVKRVEAFINPPELDNNLIENLERLNRLRNQLEHYAIDADMEAVVEIINAIHKPILNLFEKHIGTFTQLQTHQINKTLNTINHASDEYHEKANEVFRLINNFNGERVSGHLFGIDEEIILPKFNRIYQDYNLTVKTAKELSRPRQIVDIWAEIENLSTQEANNTKWAVEIKISRPAIATIRKVAHYARSSGAIPWLIVFNQIPHTVRAEAKELNVMISGTEKIEELKKVTA